MDKTNNFDEVMKLIDQLDKVMVKVDEAFEKYQRGGLVNTTVASTQFVGTLKKAQGLFKKGMKLSTERDYTEEQKVQVEERVKALQARFETYAMLVNSANEIAKGFLNRKKAPIPPQQPQDPKPPEPSDTPDITEA